VVLPAPHVVDVWVAPLDLPEDRQRALWPLLSDDEHTRASRFFRELDRRRFAVARGTLRSILAAYLDRPPAGLAFGADRYGKPYLLAGAERSTLRFNLAHSGELAVYAFVQQRQVGVDVEQIHDLPDAPELARRFFSPYEHEVFVSLPESQRLEAFFTCWTRKEAYLKGHGSGLSQSLQDFDVTLAPGSPASLLRHRTDPGMAGRWSLWHLVPAPGYVGALAVENGAAMIRCWSWQHP